MTLATLLVVVVLCLLVLLALTWWAARQMKQGLERGVPGAQQERRTIRVSPACVGRMRVLTGDPVLLELGGGVLRYQIGKQPLTRVSVATGETDRALREIASVLVTEFGASWMVVVRPVSDECLMVDRLSQHRLK